MAAEPPQDLPHLLHEALSQVGWNADPNALAQRVLRLDKGLPLEDEFAVICTWLGHCALVHKLDQLQAPKQSTDEFQIPDLLAVFERNGERVTCLVEVKGNTAPKLSFKPEYMNKLRAYGELLKLPVLIAWKYHGMWALFELDHMTLANTNYNIRFEKAFCQSLLGILAGDFSYTLPEGVGVHMRFKKLALNSSEKKGDGVIEEDWTMVLDDVYFIDREGSERRDVPPEIQTLLFSSALETVEEHTPSHMHVHMTVGEHGHDLAHRTLLVLLNWHVGPGGVLNWREVVGRQIAVPNVGHFGATVSQALHEKFVTYIFHVEPRIMPAFLGPQWKASKDPYATLKQDGAKG